MKEVIGSTWVFSLVVAFMFLFSGFLALSISYSKIFKLKNEVLVILEKYEGLTPDSHQIINNLLSSSGYKTKGDCSGWRYGQDNLQSSPRNINKVQKSKTYFYCLTPEVANKSGYIHYEVSLFYRFNLPVLGEFTNFKITGRTKEIYSYDKALIASA